MSRPQAPIRLSSALALGFLASLALAPEATADAKWGPFRGQFVDIETGQPIAGAVVVVTWRETKFNFVHSTNPLYAVEEAVSGTDGRFEVSPLSRPLMGLAVQDPSVSWFAPGYVRAGMVVTPLNGTPFLDSTVLQMRRRTPGQTPAQPGQSVQGVSIPGQRHGEIMARVNGKRRELGLPPIDLYTGEIQ